MFDFDENGDIILVDDKINDKPKEDEEDKSVVSLNLFKDIINNILAEKNTIQWEAMKKTYSEFVINRVLSAEDTLIPLMCRINQLPLIKGEFHYKLLHGLIKPKKKRYLKYLKNGEVDKTVDKISKFFNINKNKMDVYLSKLNKDDVKKILKHIDDLDKSPIKKKSNKSTTLT